MDYKRYLLILLLILLILIPYSFSVPPSDTIIFSGETGLEIEFPIVNIGKLNRAYDAYFHIFNATDGYAYKEGDNINCTLHIYDPFGQHKYINSSTTFINTYDIEFDIPSTVFSSIGEYSYIIQCENLDTGTGGYVSRPIYINNKGVSYNTEYIPIIFIFVIMGLVYYFIGNLNQENIKMDATKVSTWLTVISYTMIIIKIISLSYFAYGFYINTDISGLLQTLFILDFILISILIIFTLFFGVIAFSSFGDDANKWDPRKW